MLVPRVVVHSLRWLALTPVALVLPSVVVAQDVPTRALAPFVRLEAGTLNPGDPFAVTLAYGGAVGVAYRRHALIVHLAQQSRNRNSGPDLTSSARRYAAIAWEYAGLRSGVQERQGVLRLGLGRVTRQPFRTAWFLDAAAMLRYRVAPVLAFLGTLQYAPIAIPEERFVACGPGEGPYTYREYCSDAMITGRVQHNFGFLLGLELRPLAR